MEISRNRKGRLDMKAETILWMLGIMIAGWFVYETVKQANNPVMRSNI